VPHSSALQMYSASEFLSRVNVSGPNISLLAIRRIFLLVGLVPVVGVPFTYGKLDNEGTSARFLTPRAPGCTPNWYCVSGIRKGLLFAMSLLNVGASVTNTLGLLILTGLRSDKHSTT
jgi:hypothetical protein